jgi:hypothetical protein
MKKSNLLIATVMISEALSSVAFAGEWKQDATGWWYESDNGSYPVNCWQEINGKQYYFDGSGYLLLNTTTPDGKQVGADGVMIPGTLFNLDLGDSQARFVKYELTTALYNNSCIIIYYDYTNNSDKDQSASGSSLYIRAIQNGVEHGIDVLSRNVDEIDNYYKYIAPGSTITVAEVFEIKDKTPLTLEFEKIYSLRDCRPIGSAVLNLE